MVDKRRRPFVAIDQLFPFKKTCERLEDEFGPAGPLAFLYLLMAAKRAPVQGEITVTSEAEFWATLGFRIPPEFTMDAFLTLLGRIKQTSRTPVGRALNVSVTKFEEWQKLPDTEFARQRSARKRKENTRDETRTTGELNEHVNSTERRGEERTKSALPLPVDEGDEHEPPPQQAAATRTNGRIPRDEVPAYPTAEHHKHYRPDKAEQYARNIGATLTTALLEQDLRAEFAGIPADEAHRLATEYGSPA